MALFSHNLNTQILIAIEYAKALLQAGYSIENILSNISKKKWDDVSASSGRILKCMTKGKSLNTALKEEADRVGHKNLKKLIVAFNVEEGVDMKGVLTSLSDLIVKEKQLTADSLIDSLTGSLQKAMTVLAMPLIIFFVVFLQSALAATELTLRPNVDYAIYTLTAGILLVILIRMRYKE